MSRSALDYVRRMGLLTPTRVARIPMLGTPPRAMKGRGGGGDSGHIPTMAQENKNESLSQLNCPHCNRFGRWVRGSRAASVWQGD